MSIGPANSRYAVNQAEFCSALMAMKRLKKFRKQQANKSQQNGSTKHRRKVDYILVFAGNKKSAEDGDNSKENDESYLYLDNEIKERITQIQHSFDWALFVHLNTLQSN